MDYYSRWIEIAKLQENTSSASTINQLKSTFAKFGIPKTVISDNGPQYSSREFAMFAHEWGFTHVTSSPTHPSGNGEAERAVRTVKKLLQGGQDPYIALLNYRAAPLANGHSPSELLMSRKIRTKIPTVDGNLKVKPADSLKLEHREEIYREKQRHDFDHRHRTHTLPTLQEGDQVFLPDRQESGQVTSSVHPRSVMVQTPKGVYRRHRSQLNLLPKPTPEHSRDVSPGEPRVKLPQPEVQSDSTSPKTTRSGREVKLPGRFSD